MSRAASIEEGDNVGLLGSREGLHGQLQELLELLWLIWCMFNLLNKLT